MQKIEELKKENQLIANSISKAEQLQDHNEAIRLKKILYTNKLAMLNLITVKNEKRNISASELKTKVAKMKPAVRYETGLNYLDSNLKSFSGNTGFEVGSLIILGGQSTAGKSTVMLDILSNISKYAKCIFFNFEMGDRRLNYKLGKLLKTKEQWENFTINSGSRDLDDLLMEINILADEGVVFFAIDSKMKITVKGNEAEYQKISAITKRLSEVAIKNDIIILLINQISEENLKLGRMSFKGSGDQLYDADMALFLIIEEDGTRVMMCTKNRQDDNLFKVGLPKTVADFGTVTEFKDDIEIPIL
jgi:replicative DNA helicase